MLTMLLSAPHTAPAAGSAGDVFSLYLRPSGGLQHSCTVGWEEGVTFLQLSMILWASFTRSLPFEKGRFLGFMGVPAPRGGLFRDGDSSSLPLTLTARPDRGQKHSQSRFHTRSLVTEDHCSRLSAENLCGVFFRNFSSHLEDFPFRHLTVLM